MKGARFESIEDVSTHEIRAQKVISNTVSEPDSEVGVPIRAQKVISNTVSEPGSDVGVPIRAQKVIIRAKNL